jgi:2-haloacid dehalogenase
MLNFESYQVLTFDCYGTLIDWEQGILGALRPVLSAHHLDLPDDQILELYATLESQAEAGAYRLYKSVLRQVVEGFGSQLHFVPSHQELACLATSLQHWAPFPDTVAALQTLKRTYKLAVISNTDEDLFASTAEHLQVEFDWVITAERVQSYKPSLQNFTSALASIGLAKTDVLHVAQSMYHDIVPAKQLGLSAVWVNRYGQTTRAGATLPAQAQPDLTVPDLRTLVTIMGLGSE